MGTKAEVAAGALSGDHYRLPHKSFISRESTWFSFRFVRVSRPGNNFRNIIRRKGCKLSVFNCCYCKKRYLAYDVTNYLAGWILPIIIQQIVTLSKYGHDALDICHPWVTEYPAVYVASYVGRKSEVRKCRQRDLKMLGCFVISLLNNKTIILLNLAEYRLILADSAYGLVG